MAIQKNNIEISRLQKEIASYLTLGSTEVIFEFDESSTSVRLNLITVNPRHNQSFLFHLVEGHSEVECLKEMLEYVKTYKEKRSSYTIQWSSKMENELQTSYFRAKDIPEAIEKLQFGRDPNSLIIFSVVLNPMS
jgi:hypothetical protein